MDFNNFDDVFEFLIENGYFTFKELQLVAYINGNTISTLNNCIYARYGYHGLKQLINEK